MSFLRRTLKKLKLNKNSSSTDSDVLGATTKADLFGFVTQIRFRKTRFIPRRAPSKIYYVRQPTPKDPEEMAYLDRELKHYNTKIKSI